MPTAARLRALPALVDELWMLGVHAINLSPSSRTRPQRAPPPSHQTTWMVQAIQAVRAAVPKIVISGEVCDCAWTTPANASCTTTRAGPTCPRPDTLMPSMATLHAQAGADIIVPAAVLDGSLMEVRRVLDERGLPMSGSPECHLRQRPVHRLQVRDEHRTPPRQSARLPDRS
ncbi:hypothetical protein [Nocardia sp. NPDC051833]|uniref:hypothetical protein n=1 Tax=Nocardia sp. NPDC051833 TaxID=3155674 RepID=UPI00343062CC